MWIIPRWSVHGEIRPDTEANLAGSWLMETKKIAELNASDLDRVARYKSTHTQWNVHVSGPLQAIHHLPNETQLTIGIAVVNISHEYRQDETVTFEH
ncbi:hypothetical protein KXD96_10395 [Mycobacterium sp. SMC-2]|uniref:hypothetical protein n=1 Tax=Mycobacterium sp. SMC-2 TaxID=2857058 RepID=UPI0021B2CD66|nr:hypothetical protein [Mycobacterium sp. SMC-2]UXA08455.1 hypothetical protein KXD96_10395 [Mycobacterium sp. SMC-2]